VRAAIEARGAELRFLPPYSPDLNPIEQVFAKLKNLVRKAAPRDVEALWNTIGDSLARFSARECANHLAHSGYPRMMRKSFSNRGRQLCAHIGRRLSAPNFPKAAVAFSA